MPQLLLSDSDTMKYSCFCHRLDAQLVQTIAQSASGSQGTVQAMVAATEQHWNAAPPANMQAAKYVCEAHVLSVGNPNLLFVSAQSLPQASVMPLTHACPNHVDDAVVTLNCAALSLAAHSRRCFARHWACQCWTCLQVQHLGRPRIAPGADLLRH